jgi:hypothetical protein
VSSIGSRHLYLHLTSKEWLEHLPRCWRNVYSASIQVLANSLTKKAPNRMKQNTHHAKLNGNPDARVSLRRQAQIDAGDWRREIAAGNLKRERHITRRRLMPPFYWPLAVD